MSKRKHKAYFDAQSKTLEKYAQTLTRSNSGDTVLRDQGEERNDTEAPLREDMVVSKLAKDGFLEIFKKMGKRIFVILGWVGGIAVIVTICVFLSNLCNSMERVETEVKDLAKESRTQDQDIRISLAKILEKFDRLFDNLQRIKK